MNYRWLVILACVLVTACNPSSKEEAKNADKAVPKAATEVATPAEEATETKGNPAVDMVAEYDSAFGEFVKNMRAAKPAERAAVSKTNPVPEFAEKFRTLASDNPDSEIEATALAWLASNSDQADEKVSALATMLEKYADSPAMKEATSAIASGKPSQEAEDNLRSIMKNSPHREARGAAAHHLVSYFDRYGSLSDRVDDLAKNPRAAKHFGEEGLKYLRNMKVDDADIEALYETIVKDYSDVVISQFGRETIIGEAAENALFEIRHLSMGCVAPDIEGRDLDGKEFALSEYRGKVVMLDFWGDW